MLFRRHSSAWNGGAIVVLFVLLVILPLVASATLVQHRNRKTSEDRTLAFEATRQAENVEDYFSTSRSLTQILAQNPAFASFYTTPGRRVVKIREAIEPVREANEALAYLEQLFPQSIGEACFIDASGPENARAVKGRIESIGNLSPDETKANFFRPTFGLGAGEVYQSRPYLSPDTNEWVIANSAPVEIPGRATPAIVHFEVTLESLRKAAQVMSESADVQIVEASTGETIVDTRHPFVGPKLPTGLRQRALPSAGELGMRGLLTVGGHRVAYRRLQSGATNANDWIVLTRSRQSAAGILGAIGAWQAVLFLALLLLVPVAFVGWRRSQGDLNRAAHTDGLTGLGNRRSLTTNLARRVADAAQDRPVLLAIYDLDGFKLYNDTYGHPAGDALLTRLAHRLTAMLAGIGGEAYRMGGDEFCIVVALRSADQALDVAARAAEALEEHGEGFSVTASYGAVLLPTETLSATDALRIADQRMYTSKSSSRLSVPRQMTDVLVQMSAERNAELGKHVAVVAELAEAVALRLGLPRDRADETKRAASLHDIGKLAIPESILAKPGPLDTEELAFVRQHTLIGERILLAAPSLARCAAIVRASHESWDGHGYPDRLAGEQIPVEARIIAVCDAFESIVSERPYRATRTTEEAVAELRRCAGTQFDPQVVQAFVAELDRIEPGVFTTRAA
jgi:diguanylate cyclase (GGDEF)-like protein